MCAISSSLGSTRVKNARTSRTSASDIRGSAPTRGSVTFRSRRSWPLGLPVTVSRAAPSVVRFRQPCMALCADRTCRVYADRPLQCRTFECGVFKAAHMRQPDGSSMDAQDHRELSAIMERMGPPY